MTMKVMVADERMRMFKKARLALDACDRELEDKGQESSRTEARETNTKKKLQIEELEVNMFQLKANEAKHKAIRTTQESSV